MKVLITGSPDITDKNFIVRKCVDVISKLQYMFDVRTPDVEIVSVSENRGVPRVVEFWAKDNKLKLKTFTANWNDITTHPVVIGTNHYGEYNKLAGSNRNASAVSYIKDRVIACIAFDDGRNKSVKDVVRLSKKADIPTWQINCKNIKEPKIKIWNDWDGYGE